MSSSCWWLLTTHGVPWLVDASSALCLWSHGLLPMCLRVRVSLSKSFPPYLIKIPVTESGSTLVHYDLILPSLQLQRPYFRVRPCSQYWRLGLQLLFWRAQCNPESTSCFTQSRTLMSPKWASSPSNSAFSQKTPSFYCSGYKCFIVVPGCFLSLLHTRNPSKHMGNPAP